MGDAILNEEIFDQLMMCEDDPSDPAFVREVVELFQEQTNTEFPKMQALLDDGSPESMHTFSRAAHLLKGSAAGLGAQKCQQLCQDLQFAGENNKVDECKEKFVLLQEKYKEAEKLLLAIINGEVPTGQYHW
eukprot:GCRY01001738.1.p1 GENE.GCRY01001738.1~~GCRY01001738.1.p1  ORF type:complete len:132 (+),score=21.22 GCRY01001738.1:172-567(+)